MVTFEEINDLYSVSRALIFPSLNESFGLPLLEAQYLGIPIIASELDYVREVVDPIETFNPQSANSIATAVKRFIGVAKRRKNTLAIDHFIDFLMSRNF